MTSELEHCRRETTLKGERNLRVFVLNKRGEPLMPCSVKRARLLLKNGQARIIRYNPFTIQLTVATGESKQDISIGIDTGAKHIGIAITSEDKVLSKGEIELRDDISDNMKTRLILRKARRSRNTRYRPVRFLNRSRKNGWLPPSVQSKIDATFKWMDIFSSLVPDPYLSIEVGKFDIAKMINPNITGVDYQNGDCKDYYSVRYFVFARDKYICQVCKKKNTILHTHHIIFKSCGGTNRADNLISVCTDCHTNENHKEGGILYNWMQNKKGVKQYREAAFMNIVRKRIFQNYPRANITYGSETTPRRRELQLDKTHYNDAIVISGIKSINFNPDIYFYYKQFRNKKRSLHESIPRKGRANKNTESKRANKNVKFRAGIYLGDKVKYNNSSGYVYGFAGGEKHGKECVIRDIEGNLMKKLGRNASLTIDAKSLCVMNHNNGWMYAQKL